MSTLPPQRRHSRALCGGQHDEIVQILEVAVISRKTDSSFADRVRQMDNVVFAPQVCVDRKLHVVSCGSQVTFSQGSSGVAGVVVSLIGRAF